MKRIKHIILLASFIFSGLSVTAQEGEFTPSGKPVIKTFAEYHSIFTEGEANNAFQITRAYVGYQYAFSENFSAKVVMDFGDPSFGKFQMTAYLKNAYLKYEHKNLAVSFGMISTTAFKVQEDFWGYRYLYKSFQDAYKFYSSADLGMTVNYKFSKFLSADFSLFNGDGYKIVKVDSSLKVAGGITARPIKNLVIRAYYDYMEKEAAQQTMAIFAGYTLKKLSLGAEYNYQLNHDMVENKDFYGYSIYTSYQLHERWSVFGRYDDLSSTKVNSDDDDPWNLNRDGQIFIGGFDYNPVKGVTLALNYRGWIPADDNKSLVHGAYLNVEFKL